MITVEHDSTRLARRLSLYFSPPVMPVVAGSAVSWRTTWPHHEGLWWGLCGSGSWALLCAVLVLIGVRLGWWPTTVPSKRGPRLTMLATAVAAAVAVWLVCGVLGAPVPLLELGSTAPLLAALLLACTWATNVSLHTSAATAGVTLLTLQLGSAWALLYLLVAAIGWARLHLRVHTPAQIAMGAALGAGVCAAVVCLTR